MTGTQTGDPDGRPSERRAARQAEADRARTVKPKRSKTMLAITVVLEVALTVGVGIGGFSAWQIWGNTAIHNAAQESASKSLAIQWIKDSKDPKKKTVKKPLLQNGVPVMAEPPATTAFAVIYIPRFGAQWHRTIREGVNPNTVLNSYTAGVGHYVGNAMPGGLGNFAVAAHDTGYGDSFLNEKNLRLGDKIYVQTSTGWYTYTFRNLEYVKPNGIPVLDGVPDFTGIAPTDRVLTMTTCNPPYVAGERMIAYSLMTSYTPLSSGTPKELQSELKG